MTTLPVIADKVPEVGELAEGTYYWCRCGLSKSQPYCDGSHSGSDFSPMEFVIEKAKRYALCKCKQTQNPPFCDGSHKKL